MSFYASAEERVARQPHVCNVCSRKIERGETYEHQNSYQDRWVSWRTCAHCRAAVDTAWNLRLLDDEWDSQQLIDALAEHSVTTARLAVGIRRRWLAFCGYKLLPVPAVVPRRCIDCAQPVDAPHSYTWCAPCDERRRARVSRQFDSLLDSLRGGQ